MKGRVVAVYEFHLVRNFVLCASYVKHPILQ